MTINPNRFNKTIITRQEEAAAKMNLRSWWAECPPSEFYTRARAEADRMRGSTGSRWVEGLQHEHARQYETKKIVPWAGH